MSVFRSELFKKSTSMTAPVNPVDQDYLFLRGLLKEKKMLGEVRLLRSDTVKTVVIPAVLLFDPDSSKLSPQGKDFLTQVAAVIKDREYPITLNGHTDDAPARATGRENNWYVSAERALSVLLFLVEKGVKPDRLAAFGLAGFRPLVPNTDPQNRRLNNRVEMVMDSRDTSQYLLPEAEKDRKLDFRGFTFDLMGEQ